MQTYTTTLGPGDKSGRLLSCPVQELTLGDLSDLQSAGAQIFLSTPTGTGTVPFIDVDPFGVKLRDQVNYTCGDAVTFAVQASTASRSGYQVVAYFRTGGA